MEHDGNYTGFAILGFGIVMIASVRYVINMCVTWIMLLVCRGLELSFNIDGVLFFSFFFSLPYKSFFGGVSALTPEHYMKMNGFPNTYWGSGGENDDIATRY